MLHRDDTPDNPPESPTDPFQSTSDIENIQVPRSPVENWISGIGLGTLAGSIAGAAAAEPSPIGELVGLAALGAIGSTMAVEGLFRVAREIDANQDFQNRADAAWLANRYVEDEIGSEALAAHMTELAPYSARLSRVEMAEVIYDFTFSGGEESYNNVSQIAEARMSEGAWTSDDRWRLEHENASAEDRIAELDNAVKITGNTTRVLPNSPLTEYSGGAWGALAGMRLDEVVEPLLSITDAYQNLRESGVSDAEARYALNEPIERYLAAAERAIIDADNAGIAPDLTDYGIALGTLANGASHEMDLLRLGNYGYTNSTLPTDVIPHGLLRPYVGPGIDTDPTGAALEPGSTIGPFEVGPDGELIPQHTELPVEAETSLAIADLDDLRAEAEALQGTYEIEVLMSLTRLGGDPTMALPLGFAEEPPASEAGSVQPGIIGGSDLTPDPPPNPRVGPITGGPDPTQDRGGVIAFAGGGVVGSGGLSLIGEEGPELLDLPAGSYIHSNMSTEGLLTDLGGSSGGMETHYNSTEIHINGIRDVQSLLRELRREMRYQGMDFVEVGRGGRLR